MYSLTVIICIQFSFFLKKLVNKHFKFFSWHLILAEICQYYKFPKNVYKTSKLLEMKEVVLTLITDKYGRTSLHYSCRNGHIDITELLLVKHSN